jgi:hypothetical protein
MEPTRNFCWVGITEWRRRGWDNLKLGQETNGNNASWSFIAALRCTLACAHVVPPGVAPGEHNLPLKYPVRQGVLNVYANTHFPSRELFVWATKRGQQVLRLTTLLGFALDKTNDPVPRE